MTVLARFQYRYGEKDWRWYPQEVYDVVQKDDIAYTVADGQIIKTVETKWEYAAAEAAVPVNIILGGPGYLYADGKYYDSPFFTFRKTHIITSEYSAYDANSYVVQIDDYNVLTGKHTFSTAVVDGKIPLAPTIGSALSNLLQRPITGTLNLPCDYTENTLTIQSQWAENETELNNLARRAAQLATAIDRTVTMKDNPYIYRGGTVRLKHPKRSIDALHLVWGRNKKYNGATGEATMDLWMKYFVM